MKPRRGAAYRAVCYIQDISDIQDECLVVVTPRFCGVNPKHKDVLDELERECLRVRAMETKAAGKHGGDRTEQVSQNKNGHLNKLGPNTSARRLAKLKRDHPDIAKRVEAGEFKTVAAAERAAGVGRPIKTPESAPGRLQTVC